MTISQALKPFVDSNALAGAVALVASPSRVLGVETVGYADRAAKVAMRPDHLFWIASTSKPLTATALMMLVDAGSVDVEAPVSKYLPEYAGQMLATEQTPERVVLRKPASEITVRQVLNHTSGLPFMSRLENGRIDSMSLREACISYSMSPLGFEPGSQYAYSNAGTNTAGRIIEVVSGISYEEFMLQRLLRPLGMVDTTFRPSPEQLMRLAKAYKPNEAGTDLVEIPIGQLTTPYSDPRRGPSPAGGYFSTVSDLEKFGRMLLSGGTLDGKRYLSAKSLAQMTSKQTGALESSYGFCWGVDAATGNFGHGGALSNDFHIDVKNQLVLILMVQHAGFGGPDGAKVNPAFKAAAVETYARHSRAAGT